MGSTKGRARSCSSSGKRGSQFGNGTGVETEAVETIRQICFGDVHGSITWISMTDLVKDPFKGSTELHGLLRGVLRSKGEGIRVHTVERQIHDDAGSPVALRDYTHWGNSKADKVAHLL